MVSERRSKRQRRSVSDETQQEAKVHEQHEQQQQQEEREPAAATAQPLLPNMPPDPSTLVALDLLVPVPPVDQREFLDWGALQAYVGGYAQCTQQVRPVCALLWLVAALCNDQTNSSTRCSRSYLWRCAMRRRRQQETASWCPIRS